MFTRKHYIKVAATIAEARERIAAHESSATRELGIGLMDDWTQILADEFQDDNPRFDRSRFYHACGAIEEV
jgi:hypothetical protein